MLSKYKNLILLHFIVFIWGFTGILGALISIPSDSLVWFRMIIALASMFAYLLFSKKAIKIEIALLIKFLLVGLCIALHWIFFFEAIKVSNVSVTLACISSATLFTALLEPLFFKRKIIPYEIILGIMVLLGLYTIFSFETSYRLGIAYTLFSAFMASLFTVINGKFAKVHNAGVIGFYEMIGGAVGISIYFLLTGKLNAGIFHVPSIDWMWLILLGTVCTAFAFIASISIMKEITPYTVTMTTNLEPVYGILLALLLFPLDEKMSSGFYLGTLTILGSIFIDGFLKNRQKKKLKTFINNSESPYPS
jgi:drug/metabolite transporter (DMT)-like permease